MIIAGNTCIKIALNQGPPACLNAVLGSNHVLVTF